jgi:hypothetical protein
MGPFSGNHLYDLESDPQEDDNRAGEKREREHALRLRDALLAIDAPSDHLERLGLT